MTDRRLTELTELTAPADGDLLYAVDVSDTTESAQGSSRKIQHKNARGIPQTAAESSAGVTPTNYQYEPGDVRRYGASEGGTITTALQAAVDANDDVIIPLESCSADRVNLRTGVTIRGLGMYATTITRSSTNRIFGNSTATTGNVIRDLTLDGDDDFTDEICNFNPGTNDFLMEDVRFINYDNGSSAIGAIEFQTSATVANENITLRRVYFEDSNSVTANYQSVVVYNPIGVTFENCRAVNSGSITTACNASYSTALGDIWYIGNYFENVDASSVLVRVNGSNIVENINIIGNTFKAVSPTLEKFCITVGNHQTATSGGIVRNVTVKGNTARLTDAQCDGFIIVGDAGGNLTECSDVTISGNTADFRDSSGTLITTGNTNQRGIWAVEVAGLSITGNTIRGAQSFGIGVDGCTGFSVGNNVVTECLRNSSANANESAIYFNDSHTINCARGVVSDNTVIDSGAGGTVHAGIGSNALSTITDILVVGNNTEDTRGTPGMTYGYRFSSSNSRIVYGTNKTRGAATSDYNGAGVITYTPSNVATDRAFDANAAAGGITSPPTQAEVENIRDAVLEIADVVGTLVADLQGKGIVQ